MQQSPEPSAAPAANIPAPATGLPLDRLWQDPTIGALLCARMQCKKAQQCLRFLQEHAQTIAPETVESVTAALASIEIGHEGETGKEAMPLIAAGQTGEDPAHKDLPENESRLFWSGLEKVVYDNVIRKALSTCPSFNMARAQQLLQIDTQTITPEALESFWASIASARIERKKRARTRKLQHHPQKRPKLPKKSVLLK